MPEPEDTLIGKTLIDKYKVLRQLGRGGMGVVYEAEHIELGKRVAIKLMLEKYAEDSEAITRFKREALAASRIGNAHIIDISDIGTSADGRLFVVMELLIGSSLADLISQTGPMAPDRAINIIRQVLRAVGAAHAKHIVHRDLKPDNIFLVQRDDQEDFVKLLDFGISKVVDQAEEIAATKLTSTGAVIGTPLYMAPEQAMGAVTDQRVDIYALGVILYEMLSGRPPFVGVTYPVLVVKLLTVDPDLLSDVRPGLPGAMVAAVHRALEKEPAARFPTCEAFAQALSSTRRQPAAAASAPEMALDQTMHSGHLAAAVSTLRGTAKSSSPTQPPAKQRSHLPIIVGALGALAIGSVVVMVVLKRDPEPAPRVAITSDPITLPAAPIETHAEPPAVEAAKPPAAGSALATVEHGSAAPLHAIATSPTPKPTPAPVRRATPKVAAAGTPPPLAPTPLAAPAAPAANPAGTTTTDDVAEAIKRRDGKGCRAALASLTSPPSTDFRVMSMHAVCEMVAGNCEGGTQEQRALYVREGTPGDSANIIADLYCPLGTVPDVRLRRLSKQISMFPRFDCNYYLGPARDAAKVAQSDRDRQIIGSLLSTIATCFSHRKQCDVARKVLGEAQVFIPALALNELNSACR